LEPLSVIKNKHILIASNTAEFIEHSGKKTVLVTSAPVIWAIEIVSFEQFKYSCCILYSFKLCPDSISVACIERIRQ
jgi:hypothetical protein